MARVIKPYSRQSFGVSVSNPQGNAQATNEYTGNLKNLEQRIGQLTDVAFKMYDQQMAEQGALEALDEPINVDQWANSTDTEKIDLIGGNTVTTRGKAKRQTQLSVLSSHMLREYEEEMAVVYNDAIKKNISLEEYQGITQNIKLGYLESMKGVDAETRVKFINATNTTQATYGKSFGVKKIEEYKTSQQITVAAYANNALTNKLKVWMGDSYNVRAINRKTGETIEVNLDEVLQRELLKEISIMKDLGATVSQITTFTKDWNTKIIKYKKDKLFTRLDSPQNRTEEFRHTALEGVINGTFNGDKDSQAIYNSLPEDEKQNIRKDALNWLKGLNTTTELMEKEKNIVFTKTITELKEELIDLKINENSEQDLARVYQIQKDLSVMMGAAEFETFNDKLQGDIDSGMYIDSTEKKLIEERIRLGDLSLDDLVEAKNNNYISAKTFEDYAKELKTSKKDGMSFATEHLKLHYMPQGLINIGEKSKVALQKKFAEKKEELREYVDSNPDVTKNEIIAFARGITEKDKEEEIKNNIKTTLKKNLRTSLVKKKFNDAYNHLYDLPDYKEQKSFETASVTEIDAALNDVREVTHIRDTLQIIQEQFTGENANPIVDPLGFDFLGIESIGSWEGEKLHTYTQLQLDNLIEDLNEYIKALEDE